MCGNACFAVAGGSRQSQCRWKAGAGVRLLAAIGAAKDWRPRHAGPWGMAWLLVALTAVSALPSMFMESMIGI